MEVTATGIASANRSDKHSTTARVPEVRDLKALQGMGWTQKVKLNHVSVVVAAADTAAAGIAAAAEAGHAIDQR